MRYCPRCVLPDTRPDLWFDNQGNCNCARQEDKDLIDWNGRTRAFREILRSAKARSKGYDCVIPVSGGKDSHWQVVTCLEAGLKPLCVTWKTPARTRVGARNLANLLKLGVDHIDFQINPDVERKFILKTLGKVGSPTVPMHLAMVAIPLTIAARFDIPLVVWGENSAFEYGGPEIERQGLRMNEAWIQKCLATNGTTATDWIGKDLTRQDLTPYFAPTWKELDEKSILPIFLGAYFPWDPVNSYKVAYKHGFRRYPRGPKVGYYDFADIDDAFLIPIHHYLKWYKFGFSRSFDNLSIEIRNGRMTREDAIRIIAQSGDPTPHREIKAFCTYANISTDEFFQIIEKFRNRKIWVKQHGTWMIKDFLIPKWRWA